MRENIEKSNISQKIKNVIEKKVNIENMELVDVEFKSGGKRFLKIFIDKLGGVTLSDCKKISSQLGELLDEENLIKDKYVLEVSSPGLDRPLKTEADFKRNKGKLVKIFFKMFLESKKVVIGHIVNANDQKVILKDKSDTIIDIPIADIAKGKLEIEF